MKLTDLLKLIRKTGDSIQKSLKKFDDGMPPGYKLMTDGRNYRYVLSHGTLGLFDYPTRRIAVQQAWESYFHIKNSRERNWTPCP